MSGGFSRRTLLQGAGVAAMAAALGVSLTSCSGTAGPMTLRFTNRKRETIEYWRRIVSEFNASQANYRAELESTTNFVADFVRDTPVQIGMADFNFEFSGFVNRGVLGDHSNNPVMADIRPDVVDYVKAIGTFEDDVSCIPYALAASGVIFNRDLFDQAGAEIPTTWSEFHDVCDKLQSNDITPIIGTLADAWSVRQGMADYLFGGTNDTAEFFERLTAQGTDVGPNSEVSFSKNWREPMEMMHELLPYFNSDARNIAYDQGNRDFANGRGAMIFQGPWAFAGIGSTNPDIQAGMFPMPATDNPADTKAWMHLDQVIFTPESANDEERAGAQEMIEYLMQPDVIHTHARENLAFSPDNNAPDQNDPRVSDMNQYVLDGRTYRGASMFMPPSLNFDRYVQSYIYGFTTVEEFLGTLDTEWQRLAVRLSA